MGLLTTEHLSKIINKVKSLVFGTNNIEDGAITKAKIDPNFINEITAARVDETSLKNIIIYLPNDFNGSGDITDNIGLYSSDVDNYLETGKFIRKFTINELTNIGINGCMITVIHDEVDTNIEHLYATLTLINNATDDKPGYTHQTLTIASTRTIFNTSEGCLITIDFYLSQDDIQYTATLSIDSRTDNYVKVND